MLSSLSKKTHWFHDNINFLNEYLWSNQPDWAGRMICSWDYLTSTESLLGPPRNCLVNSLFTKIVIFLTWAKACDNRLFNKLLRHQMFTLHENIVDNKTIKWSIDHLRGVIKVVEGVSMRQWHPPLLIYITWRLWWSWLFWS